MYEFIIAVAGLALGLNPSQCERLWEEVRDRPTGLSAYEVATLLQLRAQEIKEDG